MKKFLKIAAVVVGVLVGVVVVALVYFQLTYRKDYSSVEEPRITASKDPAIVAQGEYVVNALAHCQACHQQHAFAHERKMNPDLKDYGAGYKIEAGPFGNFYPSNLSSHPEVGIGKVSDGKLARVLRHGVDRNGGMAPLMKLAVGNMSDEDLTAVVSYLRTLPPKSTVVPPDEWGLIAKIISSKFLPRRDEPIRHVPPGGISVARGEYIANGPGFCYGCHTALDMGTFELTGPRFSGEPTADPDPLEKGMEFVTPNLTPDPETGWITSWQEDAFVARMKAGVVFQGTKMPWENFRRMTEDDMRSIYRYLRSLPAVKKVTGPTHRKAGWKPG